MKKVPENNVIVEEEVKYYVFVKDGRRHYAPQYIAAGPTSIRWIFPVPDTNAVGTLDKHCNAIVFIKFGGYGAAPECKIIAQNCSEKVFDSYDYQFCPNFTEDFIAYSTFINVVVVNVKTGESFHAEFDSSMDGYITGIRFLDQQKNLLVAVKSIYESNSGWTEYLHIVKLEGRQFVDTGLNIHIGEMPNISSAVPLYHKWFVHDQKLFVYDTGKILCTDGSQPVSHPFSEIFNNNSDRIGNIKDVAIHPVLPFGVMIEDGIFPQLTVVCWEAKKPKEQIVAFNDIFESLAPLFGLNRIALAYQSFSPAGDWYVVGCLTPEAAAALEEPKDPFFIAIPVDDEHSDFLVVEDLVVLGQVKNMTSLAWTTDPASYVVSNGQLLHRWDLDELPAAREFVVPADGGKVNKKSIFRKIKDLAGF
jgi:hypothetical protein